MSETTTIEMADPVAEVKPGLLARITGAVAPPEKKFGPPIAPGIAVRLAAEEAKLKDLTAKHGDAALEAALGTPGSSGTLAQLLADIADARGRVATFKAAHAAAVDRDNSASIEATRSLRETQFRAMRNHLGARNTAAVKLAKAITEAAEQFKVLTERSAKAAAAWPIGLVLDPGWGTGALAFGELKRLVETELHRLGGDPSLGNKRSIPGAKSPHHDYDNRPDALKPMAETVEEASAALIAAISARLKA